MRHDQSARDDDRGHAGRVDEATRQRGQLGGQQDRGHHADVHRQAAHPRGGLHVHVALARIGDRAEPGGQHPDPAGGEVGDDRRGQPDERELAQRNTRAAIGQGEQAVGQRLLATAHHRDEPYWTNLRPATRRGSGLQRDSASTPSTSAMPLRRVTGPCAQDARLRAGEVDDRRRRLLFRRPAVEIHLDEIAELIARVVDGDRGADGRRCWRWTPPSARPRAAARSRPGAAASAASRCRGRRRDPIAATAPGAPPDSARPARTPGSARAPRAAPCTPGRRWCATNRPGRGPACPGRGPSPRAARRRRRCRTRRHRCRRRCRWAARRAGRP